MTNPTRSLPITFLGADLLIRARLRVIGASAPRDAAATDVAALCGYASAEDMEDAHHAAIRALRHRAGSSDNLPVLIAAPSNRQETAGDQADAKGVKPETTSPFVGLYLNELESISLPPQIQASAYQIILDHKLGDVTSGSGKVRLSRDQASTLARNLRGIESARGRALTHTQALAEIAVMTGHRNVHEMTASYQPAGAPIHADDEHDAPTATSTDAGTAAPVRGGTDGKTIWVGTPGGADVEALRILNSDHHRLHAGMMARYGHMDAVGETLAGAANLIRLALGGAVPHAHFGVLCDDPAATARNLRAAICDPAITVITYDDLARDVALFQRLTRLAFEGDGVAADGEPPLVLVRGRTNDQTSAGIFADRESQVALGTRLMWISLPKTVGQPTSVADNESSTTTGFAALDALLSVGKPYPAIAVFGVRRRFGAALRDALPGMVKEFGSRPSDAERHHASVHRERREWTPPFVLDNTVLADAWKEMAEDHRLFYTAFTGKAIQSLRARLKRAGSETVHALPAAEPRAPRPIPDDMIVLASGSLPHEGRRNASAPKAEDRLLRIDVRHDMDAILAASFTLRPEPADGITEAARNAVAKLLGPRSRRTKRT